MSETIRDEAWTRATTVASTLADRYGLEKWGNRNVVLGIAAREDLYAQAASCRPEDKDTLNKIVEQAQEAAKSRSGANLGTALHTFTERLDRGEEVAVPAQWKPDVDAYLKTMATAGVQVLPEWVERVVVVPILRVAGTLDRLVAPLNQSCPLHGIGCELDKPMVADIKTGQDVTKYGMGEIVVQLAIYAGASHAWKRHTDDIRRDRWGRYLLPDPTEKPEDYEPMLDVDREHALVIHLPVESGECHLHIADIAAGREAVRKAMWVREWRKTKGLSQPLRIKPTTLREVFRERANLK